MDDASTLNLLALFCLRNLSRALTFVEDFKTIADSTNMMSVKREAKKANTFGDVAISTFRISRGGAGQSSP